jgi:hypothetical protein
VRARRIVLGASAFRRFRPTARRRNVWFFKIKRARGRRFGLRGEPQPGYDGDIGRGLFACDLDRNAAGACLLGEERRAGPDEKQRAGPESA